MTIPLGLRTRPTRHGRHPVAPHRSQAGRATGDAGSTMVLVPAATLIVVVLGALAIDLSQLFLAKRQLLDAAASVANDAVGAGAVPGLGGFSDPTLDPQRVINTAYLSLLAQQVAGLDPSSVRVTTNPAANTVTVELAADVDRFFGKALPGSRRTRLTARATALGHAR